MASLEKKRSGYSCSLFVEAPPEYIRCGVCRNVLRDPQLTECCGRNVCKTCIEKDGSCPLAECGKPHVQVSFNRKCRNDIDERKVYCCSRKNGCQWVDKLEKLENHLTECGCIEEECQYCGTCVQRRNVQRHEAVCQQYPIKCQCGVTYERQHQSRHFKACRFMSVKCPFNIVGCTSEVLNKDLQKHLNDCLPDHYALVTKLNQDMQAKVEATKQLVLQEYEEKTTQLDAEIDGLGAAIIAARERVAVLQQALRKGEEEMGDLQRAQETTKYNFAAQIGVGDAEVQALKEGIDRLHFDSKVNLYGPPLPRPHQIASRPTDVPPTTHPLIPPLTFTILDFPDKKKHDVVIHTPPFLTHDRGYKMCLQIFCNGDNRGKGKFLSIYVYIIKGEYDDFLQWPFSGSITVEVRNLLKNSYNHVKTIIFDCHSNHGARAVGDQYFSLNGFGYYNFMFLSVLFPSYSLFPDFQYIRDGCLKVDVSKVKFN